MRSQLVTLASILVIGAAVPAAGAQGTIFPMPQFDGNLNPNGGGCGDFNGDGSLDLIYREGTGGTYAYRFGDGHGGFGAVHHLRLPANTIGACADMNLDGVIDFVGFRGTLPQGLICFGGPSGFEKPKVFGVSKIVVQFEIAEVNGDGIPDILDVDSGLAKLNILLGHGDGTFASGGAVDLAPNTTYFTIGDVTGDGLTDVVTTNIVGTASSQLTTYIGDGMGGFALAASQSTALPLALFKLGDIDLDGRADGVSSGGSNPSTVYLWFANFDGSFAPGVANAVVGTPTQLTLADLDFDGYPDLVTCNSSECEITTLHNLGFGPLQEWKILPGGTGLVSCVVGDFNADGVPDLAPIAWSGASLLLGLGMGEYEQPPSIPLGVTPTALAGGDFDGDGRADALVFDGVGGAAALLPGDGHGSFGAAVAVPLAKIPAIVVARDMNLDGELDLVAGTQQSAEVDVFMGDGHGAFLAPVVSHASENFQSMAIDDVDGDGIPDLVAGFGYQGAGVLLGNGDASLSQVSQCTFQSVAVTRIRLADLDGNGLPEIVASHDHAAGSVQVLANIGGGHFRNPKMWGSIATDGPVEVADFDGNGRADIAVVNSDDKLIWFKGAGKTGAPAASGVEPFAMMLELHAIDLDGDGHPDLLGFDSPAGASIHLAFGSGAFQFQPVQSFLAGPQLSGGFVADLDGDGLDEIVLASRATQSLTILRPPRGRAPATTAYGEGSNACMGRAAVRTTSPPKVGNGSFGVAFASAPPSAAGVLLVTDTPDSAGSDPNNIGVLFYVDIFHANRLIAAPAPSDPSGTGFAHLPIPNNPALAGGTFYAQALWLEDPGSGLACSRSPYHVASSNAVAIVVLQ